MFDKKKDFQPVFPEDAMPKKLGEDNKIEDYFTKNKGEENKEEKYKPETRVIRTATFVATNLDLIILLIYTVLIAALTLSVEWVIKGLNAGEIVLGIEMFVKIFCIVFLTIISVLAKFVAGDGAISKAIAKNVFLRWTRFKTKIETRKEKQKTGKISPYGRSIESK